MNSKRFDDLVHEIKAAALNEQNALTLMAQMKEEQAAEGGEPSDDTAMRAYAKAERVAAIWRESNLEARAALIKFLQAEPTT